MSWNGDKGNHIGIRKPANTFRTKQLFKPFVYQLLLIYLVCSASLGKKKKRLREKGLALFVRLARVHRCTNTAARTCKHWIACTSAHPSLLHTRSPMNPFTQTSNLNTAVMNCTRIFIVPRRSRCSCYCWCCNLSKNLRCQRLECTASPALENAVLWFPPREDFVKKASPAPTKPAKWSCKKALYRKILLTSVFRMFSLCLQALCTIKLVADSRGFTVTIISEGKTYLQVLMLVVYIRRLLYELEVNSS